MADEFDVRIKKRHLVLVLGMTGIAATLAIAAILTFPVQTALSDHTHDDVDCNTIPCVHSADIVNGAVTTADILNGGVLRKDLATDSVDGSKIIDGSVKEDDIAEGSVDSSKVADESLTSADLGFQSVRSAEVAFDSLTAQDLAADSVGASELAGVTNLIFESTCTNSDEKSLDPFDAGVAFACPIPGVTFGDSVIVTKKLQSGFFGDCMDFRAALALEGEVVISLFNTCNATVEVRPGDLEAAVIVFHE
jgi:hypothetical protein